MRSVTPRAGRRRRANRVRYDGVLYSLLALVTYAEALTAPLWLGPR